MSDSNSNYLKYRIPNGTSIGAGQYLVFDESAFNASPPIGTNVSFRLSAAGDDVWLMSVDNTGGLQAFEDHVDFGTAINGESFGRWPNGAGELYPMKTLTLGHTNSGPRIGPVEISELMYNPVGGNADLEFVELLNLTNQTVPLSSTFAGVGTVPWRIEGIGFDFPLGVSMAPLGTLVVVHFDPNNPADAAKLADFRATYNTGPEVQLVGPYSGLLDNSGERVRLLRPDAPPPEDPTAVPYLLVDEVNYQSAPPWPTEPNQQNGTSLTRLEASIYADDATNWAAAAATPGNSSLAAPTTVAGDFNLNGARDAGDIQAMLLALTDAGNYKLQHNMTSADLVYVGDVTGDLSLRNTDIQTLLDLIASAAPQGGGSAGGESSPVASSTANFVQTVDNITSPVDSSSNAVEVVSEISAIIGSVSTINDTAAVHPKLTSLPVINAADQLTTQTFHQVSAAAGSKSNREPAHFVAAVDRVFANPALWRKPHVCWHTTHKSDKIVASSDETLADDLCADD